MYLENNQIRRFPLKGILAWSAVVVWMGLIFYLSHQPATESSGLSRMVSENLLRLIGRGQDIMLVELVNHWIRILAHGFSFFVLALLVSIAFRKVQVIDLPNALLTLIFSLLYAALDEWHQSAVPGRSSEWVDFFTDAGGIVLAVIILQVYWTLKRVNAELSVDV